MEPSAHREGVLAPLAASLRAALLQPFLRLEFTTVWVRDQERSRRFFVEKLAFETTVDAPTPEGGRWIIVAPPAAGLLPEMAVAGFSGIALCVPPERSADQQRIGQPTGVGFLTENVRGLFEEWSRRGVGFSLPPIEPTWGSGEATYAVFEDVDGNSFSLIEIDEATRTKQSAAPRPGSSDCNRRPHSFLSFRFRHNFLPAVIAALLGKNGIRFGPVTIG